MKRIHTHLIATILVSFGLSSQAQAQKVEAKEYTFSPTPTWSDEFITDGKPDPSFWSYDLGGGGWGNNEKQIYTNNPENVRVENGSLIIEAQKSQDLNSFSSARLVTKGKKDFLYGRLEVRAKLPVGRGTWPAIWTLGSQHEYGDNFWPDNGEMDMMEHVGMDQNRIHANIHTQSFNHVKGTNKGNNKVIEGVSEDFHIYRLDWFPDSVQFFVDEELLFQFDKQENYTFAEWPFDKPQHLLLNIAIGGNWGGQQGIDTSIFPQRMLVDYVRYYKLQTN